MISRRSMAKYQAYKSFKEDRGAILATWLDVLLNYNRDLAVFGMIADPENVMVFINVFKCGTGSTAVR